MFLEFLRSTGDVVILPQASRQHPHEEFQRFADGDGRQLGENCHLWNRAISPCPSIKHVPEQGYYWLDFMQSEVINVMRSKVTEGGLSMGRLHVEDKLLGPDGVLIAKREAFVKWFATLCRWIRRSSPGAFDGACVMPAADALRRSGIRLLGHVL